MSLLNVRYAVGRKSELTPDLGCLAQIGNSANQCALFLHCDTVYAVGSLCPHQNTPLEGAHAKDGEITCLRHGYRFCLMTGECTTLGGYGLPIYPVELEDDIVYIRVWEDD